MKNKYLSNHKRGHLSRLWVLLVMLLALPFMAQAQSLTVSPATTETNPDDYGSVAIGAVSTPAKQYTFTGTGLSGNITVSFANATSFEGSVDNVNFTSSLVLPSSGGTIFVRFRPQRLGTTTDEFIQATGPANRSTISAFIDVRGTGTPGAPTISVDPTALGFGNQVTNTTSSPMSVNVTATSLTDGITVTAPAGFQVSTTANGTYSQTLTLPKLVVLLIQRCL
ncbi:hypothetical protein MUN84_03945 [Hymenobacter sp. 5516J-16]|uniref:hypothetical protein n=1 Tax=Hymenobacter sp. 5516J-16 TaxID=2932253 RepID=UPI001FD545A6|nr:hypothetical protein [Hymenobacter sp. 5516J-16]UOQ77820.1 hypothetical protein MUN84_03945 [Hymenobacter sp. 5516J-16]